MRSCAAIQAELDLAYSARAKALEAQSYGLNTGQGSQTVTRANLTEIGNLIKSLEAEYSQAQSQENGTGIVAVDFGRY